ncbi:hypothetical protein NBNDMPCG_00015 [Klebsiella phage vB_KqM-Westerburg]|uniref:Uncharacterized protein n=1 Tax=Klebsiella phage UPM 2146 TaxID=2847816 RepID=A0A5Q2F7C0_9CAUD|nr:hypothetical protein HYQ02_gp142 [Klebsiella phage UPM 2146]QGF20717.1 hypothetical protein [Klebsiella phage UPM 2146]CAD5240446.1 hypothetical protein NBNDMPCG_00015 [Klebsiella phage vB_KqM-Westerburg]
MGFPIITIIGYGIIGLVLFLIIICFTKHMR